MPNIIKCFFDVKKGGYYMFAPVKALHYGLGQPKEVVIPGMCEHRFCSQTKTRGDRNCTACFSLANIFNQSTNKSFGAKLQSRVTGGFTQVRIGNLINQSATSCAISIPPLLEDCSEQKTFKDVARRRLR